MLEKLATPETVDHNGVPVQATHVAWHSTDHAAVKGVVYSYRITGVMDGERFVPVGQPETVEVEGPHLDTLRAPNAQGKPQNTYRNTDVIAMHKQLRGGGA